MDTGIIILAPPWPRSGSSNTFAAQVATYARRGARVLLLVTPLNRGQHCGKAAFWRDTMSAMAFPGLTRLAYARTRSARLRSFLSWVQAGRDDAIAVMTRYAASAELPAETVAFMVSARIELIHANHVFSMRLAQRIADMVEARQGQRPPILLDTHDIQSEAFVSGRRVNKQSDRVDSYEALLRTELSLCARADMLVHCSQCDLEFFSSRLPQREHALVLPTLHPGSEAELVKRRGQHRTADFDLVYVGTSHEANLETVRWLLQDVLPRASQRARERIRIIGTVGRMLASRDPELFGRHERLFLGEVPSVYDFYTAAKGILAPATAGTGSSIKLIEALCVGKPILTTSVGVRGLPRHQLLGDVHIHDRAEDFAVAASALSRRPHAEGDSLANGKLYDAVFSNQHFFTALGAVVDRLTGDATAL
jgi:glycosyltransferase involved in cell wall biosynthesis